MQYASFRVWVLYLRPRQMLHAYIVSVSKSIIQRRLLADQRLDDRRRNNCANSPHWPTGDAIYEVNYFYIDIYINNVYCSAKFERK